MKRRQSMALATTLFFVAFGVVLSIILMVGRS